MFFPYNTDAPVYHWPYLTVVLIAVNLLVLIGYYGGEVDAHEWMLRYDGALHPSQWITSNFLHAGPIHLLGNMFFLWPFGLVVEGKVGWWKFLLIYLGIGVVQSACEQAVMLPFATSTSAEGSMGASAIIFGLIGVAWVWAPRNEVTCAFFLIFRAIEFEISILVFGALMLAWQLFFVIFGATSGSELLHISGAVIGVGVGMAMLRLGLVDCEGYDVISVFRDKEGRTDDDPLADEQNLFEDEPTEFQQQAARATFRKYVRAGNPQAAIKLLQKLDEQDQPLVLDRSELAALIAALHKKRFWQDSAPLMAEYLERFEEKADTVRLKLAQICVIELDRPLRALELLKGIDATSLSHECKRLYQQLIARAKKMQAEGTLELDDEKW
jgi:membrane associated rhomboid family serine protease